MRPTRLSLLGRVIGLSLAVSPLLVGATGAQQLIDNEQIAQFAKAESPFKQRVLGGSESATQQQLELASRYYVLRLTLLENLSDSARMFSVMKDFEIITGIAVGNSKNNRKAIAEFAPHLVNRFKEVFALDFGANRLVVVNAAVLLPQLARLRQDVIGEYLASVVADEKMSDAIRVHAAKGLREYLPAAAFTKLELGNKQSMERKDRDVRLVNALIKLIDRPMPITTADPYELDGLRYIRSEAVETLAKVGVPAISAYTGKVEGPAALGLIKVLARKVQPEPNVRERLHAAIGVCHLSKYPVEYDARIGVYLVGECLIDFLGEYRKDYNNIAAKGKSKLPTYLPWKIDAKRVEVAMDFLVNNTKGTPSSNSALILDAGIKPFLKAIYNFDALEPDLPFRNAVQKLRPNTKTLFASGKTAILEFDWEPAAPAEEK